jgi:AGCS family alanine or glycine:cation symporter
MQAFGTVLGNEAAAIVIGVGIALFALSTILSWALYGTRCVEFLFGDKSGRIYQVMFVIITVVGATMDLGLAWDIADTLNGLMAIPNLIALFGLSGVVVSVTKEYFAKKK